MDSSTSTKELNTTKPVTANSKFDLSPKKHTSLGFKWLCQLLPESAA